MQDVRKYKQYIFILVDKNKMRRKKFKEDKKKLLKKKVKSKPL